MSAASTSGRPLRGAEDLEPAPAFHDVGRSERSRHPMSEGVGSLAGACDEPQAPSVEQMRRRFADDPIHDAATGANGRVANDVVERDARHRLVQIAQTDLRVVNPVRGDIRSGQGYGPLVDIRQDDTAALRHARRDDSDGTVAASKIEDQLARADLEGGEQKLCPAVDLPPGEDARIGPEHERVTPDLEANLLRTTHRFRPLRKVVLAHFDGRTMDPA